MKSCPFLPQEVGMPSGEISANHKEHLPPLGQALPASPYAASLYMASPFAASPYMVCHTGGTAEIWEFWRGAPTVMFSEENTSTHVARAFASQEHSRAACPQTPTFQPCPLYAVIQQVVRKFVTSPYAASPSAARSFAARASAAH